MAAAAIPRKLLVAVAEGGLSDAAAVFALELAAKAGAECELLHALPVPTLTGLRLSDEKVAALAAERRQSLASALAAHAEQVRSPLPVESAIL